MKNIVLSNDPKCITLITELKEEKCMWQEWKTTGLSVLPTYYLGKSTVPGRHSKRFKRNPVQPCRGHIKKKFTLTFNFWLKSAGIVVITNIKLFVQTTLNNKKIKITLFTNEYYIFINKLLYKWILLLRDVRWYNIKSFTYSL